MLRRRCHSMSDLEEVRLGNMEGAAYIARYCTKPAPAIPLIRIEVAEIKIPDGNYKSGFQEPQKKYQSLEEQVKDMESRLSILPKLEKEVKALQTENKMMKEKLEEMTLLQEK